MMTHMESRILPCTLALAGLCTAHAAPPSDTGLAKEIYKQLIEINTTHSAGSTTEAARAMQKRLLDAGLPGADIEVIEPFPRKGNLVARYRGTGARRPLLLLAHLDVVEARPSDWKTDPFKLREQGGYYVARGAVDDKAMAAAYVSVLCQFKREGFTPNRDIVMALTADEERGGTPENGAQWLVRNRRSLVEAEYGINEGGRGELRHGQPIAHIVQVAEKTYVDYQFEATGPGGHSARPTPDNPVYDLAEALVRLRQFQFPVRLNELARAYFDRSAPVQELASEQADFRGAATGSPSEEVLGRLSARPSIVGLLRTTCVATMVEAGQAPNALAQRATATINCRALPGEDLAAIGTALAEIAGSKVKVTRLAQEEPAPASPLDPVVLGAVERISAAMWPGVPVVPTMGVSTTDSRAFRAAGIPMYGVSGLFVDPDQSGVHGLNEKVGIKQVEDCREFLYRLVKTLASE
jgi:acetylornithine deacetylase/succinyl-diaminopimelate desuccinylase-like protein